MMKAWRSENPDQPERLVKIMMPATKSVTPAAAVKTCQSGWPMIASTTAGISMATARTASSNPITKAMGRRSIMGAPS